MSTSIAVVHTVASVDARFGGPSVTVPSLCEALFLQGADVALVTQKAAGWNRPADRCRALSCAYVPAVHSDRLGVTVPLRFGARVAQEGLRVGATIVHDHGLWLPCNHAAARAARKRGWQLVISPRGAMDQWAFDYHKARKRLAYVAYQKADLMGAALLHATSDAEAEILRSHGFRQPVAVIPNGIEVPAAVADVSAKESGGGRRKALFLSRIHPKKGLDLLLQAWARVRPEGWSLVVVGDGPAGYRSEMAELARQLGIAAETEFAGWLEGESKERALNEASLLVLPTHTENFGMAIAEALAHAVPVITTTGAPWSELESHRCGWWISRELDMLCRALDEACRLPAAALLDMGERGRSLVAAKYGWHRVAREMLEVYQWLLGAAPKPQSVK